MAEFDPAEAPAGERRLEESPHRGDEIDGSVLGDDPFPYELTRLQDREGARERWFALDPRVGRRLVIERRPLDPLVPEWLHRAAVKAAAVVAHENIAPILDAGLADGHAFTVIAADDDPEDLVSDVSAASPPSFAAAISAMRALAAAVIAAHRLQVVHGAISLRYVADSPDSRPVLSGFGLPPQPTSWTGPTHPGAFDPTPDLRALGTLAAQWFALHPPTAGTARSRDATCVVTAATATEPERRYADVEAFAADLAALAEGRPVSVRPVTRAARCARLLSREPATTAFVSALVIALSVAGILLGDTLGRRPEHERAERWHRGQQSAQWVELGFVQLAEGSSRQAARSFTSAYDLDGNVAAAVGLELIPSLRAEPRRWQGALAHAPSLIHPTIARALSSGDASLGGSASDAQSALDLIVVALLLAEKDSNHASIVAANSAARRAALRSGPTRRLAWSVLAQLADRDPRWMSEFVEVVDALFPSDELLLRLSLRPSPAEPEDQADRAQRILSAPCSFAIQARCVLLLANSRRAERRALAKEWIERHRATEPTMESDGAILASAEVALASEEGRFDEAVERARAAVLRDASRTTRLLLVRSLLGARRPSEAQVVLEAVRAEHPDDFDSLLLWIGTLNQLGSEGDLAIASELARRRPTSSGSRALLGRRLWDARRYEEGLHHIVGAIPWSPNLALTFIDVGFGLLELQRGHEALPWLDEARRLAPTDPIVVVHRARALAQAGRVVEARTELATLSGPLTVVQRRHRGLLLARELRSPADALPDLEIAHAQDPGSRDVTFQLARALQAKESHAAAYELLADAARTWPDDVTILTTLVDLAARTERFEEQRIFIERARQLRPEESKLAFAWASNAARLGHHEEARAAYRRALELNPRFAEAWCNLGLSLERSGSHSEALICLRHGHALGSRQPGWRFPSRAWIARCESKMASSLPSNAR